MALPLLNDYIAYAGLRGATEKIPRGLTILTGAVPGRDRGFGHMAPTYLCRFPGSHSDGHRGSVLFLSIALQSSWPGLSPQVGFTRSAVIWIYATQAGPSCICLPRL